MQISEDTRRKGSAFVGMLEQLVRMPPYELSRKRKSLAHKDKEVQQNEQNQCQ